MSVKIKIFKMVPENSQEISDFMDTVKVMQDGILITDSNIGVLYRTKDDIGMDTDSLITAVSGELVKAQKQFVLQDGLVRAYTAVIAKFSGDHKAAQDEADAVKAELDAHIFGYNDALELEVAELTRECDEIKAKHQNTPKKDKDIRDGLLQMWNDKNNLLKEKTAEFEAYKAEFDAKSNEISARMGGFAVKAANLMGEIKENNGLLETATHDREHARVFIGTTKQYMKELGEGSIVVG